MSLPYSVHHYATERTLQRVAVWDVDASDKSKEWVIFLHGGAWRDPTVTLASFQPAIDQLVADGTTAKAQIAAFASIDYRLSPHPDHPQDPATTPTAGLRDALHPDHLDDVRSALAWLQTTYGVRRYVLVGHSAGATLAMQVVAGGGGEGVPVPLPHTIVAIAGIYDFQGLDERMEGHYRGFLEGAFGAPTKWAAAEPLRLEGRYGGEEKSERGEEKSERSEEKNEGKESERSETKNERSEDIKFVLAWSRDDELVDEPEIDAMAKRLKADGADYSVQKDVRGQHDACWKEGTEVARLIRQVLGKSD